MPRTVAIYPLSATLNPGSLTNHAAVVIDLLRASTTITQALAAGATRIIPCLEPADALSRRDTLAPPCLLGGERRGVRIDGFDLANSPSEYTSARMAGATVIFTTTNGTRALDAARRAGASPVLIGCLNNLTAVAGSVSNSDRNTALVCAGTDGEPAAEDTLCAGAIAAALILRGYTPADDPATRAALDRWATVNADGPAAILTALRESRGGRNLIALGLDADIAHCAAIDTTNAVPILGPDGSLTRSPHS